jgi:lipoate-protein ligase A
MSCETHIFQSDSHHPWYNLAVEEHLLDTVKENQYILYLWQNLDTIVIGKNQNPWKECRAGILEKDGGYLARRLSGGGTVFHDLGNLNFTFLMSRDHYDLQKQTGVILSAIRKLGIPAEMSGRNDLTVDGRKFSGNAFCFRKNSAYHHGTILVSCNFDKLAHYLQVPEEKIRAKGIESVRSRVVNLAEYNNSLTIDTVAESLVREFTLVYGEAPGGIQNVQSLDQAIIQKLYEKYASWEWRYGEAPKFDMEISTRFDWGGIDLGLKLEKGIIVDAVVYSDALDAEFIGMIPEILKGVQLNANALADRLSQMNPGVTREPMLRDIAQWLRSKDF